MCRFFYTLSTETTVPRAELFLDAVKTFFETISSIDLKKTEKELQTVNSDMHSMPTTNQLYRQPKSELMAACRLLRKGLCAATIYKHQCYPEVRPFPNR